MSVIHTTVCTRRTLAEHWLADTSTPPRAPVDSRDAWLADWSTGRLAWLDRCWLYSTTSRLDPHGRLFRRVASMSGLRACACAVSRFYWIFCSRAAASLCILRFQRTSFLSLFCFFFFSFGGNFNCATEYIGRFKQSYGNQKRRRYFRESRIWSRTKYAFSVVFFLYRCIKFVFSLKSLESFNFWWTFLINSYFYDFLGCWRIFCEVRIVMSMKRKLYIFIRVSIKKSIVFNWMTDT